jgi:hypothetical protein
MDEQIKAERERKASLDKELGRTIDKHFLDRLIECARSYGWSGNYYEVAYFVIWCHHISDFDVPDISAFEPFQKPDED